VAAGNKDKRVVKFFVKPNTNNKSDVYQAERQVLNSVTCSCIEVEAQYEFNTNKSKLLTSANKSDGEITHDNKIMSLASVSATAANKPSTIRPVHVCKVCIDRIWETIVKTTCADVYLETDHLLKGRFLVNAVMLAKKSLVTHNTIVDSGATCHMFPSMDVFKNYVPRSGGHVTLGDDTTKLNVSGGGNTHLKCVDNAIHVPGLGVGLISISVLDAVGYSTVIVGGKLSVLDREGYVAFTATKTQSLYYLDDEYADIFYGGREGSYPR
jgi:hypothetical protein